VPGFPTAGVIIHDSHPERKFNELEQILGIYGAANLLWWCGCFASAAMLIILIPEPSRYLKTAKIYTRKSDSDIWMTLRYSLQHQGLSKFLYPSLGAFGLLAIS
jgi:hypothetical protein